MKIIALMTVLCLAGCGKKRTQFEQMVDAKAQQVRKRENNEFELRKKLNSALCIMHKGACVCAFEEYDNLRTGATSQEIGVFPVSFCELP